ncbi:MAG: trypsin-like peptidase domain-containing protein [Planctomycetes bacterium]|nr:trypsin-like peptidase domain-containing protein [Planctomycetota bacterium]
MRRLVPIVPIVLMALAADPTPAQSPGRLVERNANVLQVVEPDANERDLRLTPIVRAVQRAQDCVVSIYLQSNAQGRPTPVTEGQGSGVILDERGLVITNWHVVAPVLQDDRPNRLGVQVKLRDGRQRAARVLSSSANRDLALLQLELEAGETVHAAEIGRSGDLMIGETLIAIGNPQGHANTVTSGVLSAVGRSIQVRTPEGVRTYSDLLQTDAAINQGNSGGALLDITGKLVGINNAMAMGAENIGFAIPMDVVRDVFQHELLQSQSFAFAADAAWLGIEIRDGGDGVVVSEVDPDSPAAAAGLRRGDVLLAISDQSVRTAVDYLRRIVTAEPDRPLPLRLRRANQDLRLAPVPITRTDAVTLAAIGASFEERSADADPALVRKVTLAFYRDKNMWRVPLFPAVLQVREVRPGSPAEAIGLVPGDVLLAVFAQSRLGPRELPVTSRRDLARFLEQQRGRGLRIAVLRGDDDLTGTIDVRGAAPR